METLNSLGDFFVPLEGVFLVRISGRLLGVFPVLMLAMEELMALRELFKLMFTLKVSNGEVRKLKDFN